MNYHFGHTIQRVGHLAVAATLLLGALLPLSSNAQITMAVHLRTLEGDAHYVDSVVFSPDGTTLANTDDYGTVFLWNVQTGELLRTIDHTEPVRSVAFSPDGTTLASGGYDGTIRLWNPETGEELRTNEELRAGEDHFPIITSVAFSPDGTTLASGSFDAGKRIADGAVRLWNAQTGELLRTIDHTGPVLSVAFSPDGTTLASGDDDGTIRLWNAQTGEELQSLEGHTDYVTSVVFSPDGTTLASKRERTVLFWDVQTGELLRTIHLTGPVLSVAFSPDGTTLASGDDDGTIRLWNAQTGEELQSLEGHTDYVTSVAFSPDGTTLASGDGYGTIRLWTLAPETADPSVEPPPAEPVSGVTTDPAMFIYWAQPLEGIQRAALDGSNEQNVVKTGLLSLPVDIVLDAAGGTMYWSVLQDDEAAIQRANLDGSGVQDIIVGLTEPGRIALDANNGKLYWTDSELGAIRRANLDGSQVEDMIVALEAPSSVVLDPEGGKMYWTDSASGKNQRANLDGSEVEDLFTSEGLGGPFDIALDVAGGKMYWVHIELDIVTGGPTSGEIRRANLDGTEMENVLDWGLGIGVPWDIALDITGGKMYWSYLEWDADAEIPFSNGKIQRANLDGTEVEDIVTDKLFPAFGIALDLSQPMPVRIPQDVNGDGVVNILDLVLVAQHLDETGENVADVNGDGVVNILDLVAVAAAFNQPAAPGAQGVPMLTPQLVREWLTQAEMMGLLDPASRRGIAVLEHLLATLAPKETALLPNYPNPFNPETWIPYQLTHDAHVRLTIYDANGALVRLLDVGHQPAGFYTARSGAAYWDGRNESGEVVASGLYFYTLTAGEFTATRKMLIRK